MKFSPQIHLFLCAAMLGNMLAPALVRAEPPPPSRSICERINTPKGKIDSEERSSNRRKLFSSWREALIEEFSRQHRSLKYISKTPRSRNAQQSYLKFVTDNVTEICEVQLEAEKKVTALAEELNKGSGQGMCSRFAEIEGIYAKANSGLTAVKGGLTQRLDHLQKILLEKSDANRSELDSLDKAGINTNENSALVTFPHMTGDKPNPEAKLETAPSPHISLRQEMGLIWGRAHATAKTTLPKDTKPDPESFFGKILTELEKEEKKLEQVNTQLAQQRQKMESTKNECAILPGQTPVKATTASDQPDISGTPKPPAADGSTKPADARKSPAASTTPGAGEKTGPGEDGNPPPPATDDRQRPPPYVPPPKDPVPTTPQKPPVEEESWVSKNSGMLLTVGAGAAAVGGLLWYKNSEDKKAKKNAAALEAEAEAMLAANFSSTSTSSTTSTSTNTDSTKGGTPANSSTPQGSKLVVSGIPSGSVAVNTKLSTITVAIINPSGILTQDSHTEIIVSCVQPAGCSLSGTGQAQASAGKAKFTDLRFTSPHQNVKLLFTSPGFDAVASTTFNVTGSGGTSTGTATATSTATATNTSTATSTSTTTTTSTNTSTRQ